MVEMALSGRVVACAARERMVVGAFKTSAGLMTRRTAWMAASARTEACDSPDAAKRNALAEDEDIGQPADGFPGWRRRAGPWPVSRRGWFGTSRSDLTSLGVGGKFMSSLAPDSGAPPDDPGGGGSDYDLNADYSTSTLDGLFPATTVTSFEAVDLWFMNDQTLFGDSDHLDGFSVNAFGSWSLVPSKLEPPEDRPGKRRSCSSDGTSKQPTSADGAPL